MPDKTITTPDEDEKNQKFWRRGLAVILLIIFIQNCIQFYYLGKRQAYLEVLGELHDR